MKRIFFAIGLSCLLSSVILSCNDGNLDLSQNDFITTSASFCEESLGESTQLLFKIKDNEALIISFSNPVFTGIEGTEAYSIGSQSTLKYRQFDGAPTADYFCAIIPEIDPKVLNEITAVSGSIRIQTAVDNDSNLLYRIEIEGAIFNTDNNTRFANLENQLFGEFVIPSL
ncbi:MAG: hypothetical protein O3C07_03785 [Bacteroidetes bacterium]|nr:hypothetical protein [Bacteroidota bacterium]